MALLNRVLNDFKRFVEGALDIELLQRRVEASVAAMDNSVPDDVKGLLEGFVRDIEIAKFTMADSDCELRGRELAGPIMGRLRTITDSDG